MTPHEMYHEFRDCRRYSILTTDIDRLICLLAHELRGPLQPIQNAAALMRRGVLDAGATRRTSEIIERQVGEMSSLIDELLDASRLRLGSVRLQRTRVAVSEILERALEACAAGMAARGHRFILEAECEALFVEADAAWLSRALQNLINNAAKYTDPGGQIRVSTRLEGDTVVVTVSDTGIGIDAAQLQMIFELGTQAGQEGTKRSAGGVGIGLYLARQLIEAHNGTIEARSAGGGKGSQFIVRMCAMSPPAQSTTC